MGGAVYDAAKPFDFTIGSMEPRLAQDLFLERFHELRFARGERHRKGLDTTPALQ